MFFKKRKKETIKQEFSLRCSDEDVKQIISLLMVAFPWQYTPQGGHYWASVIENLENLLKSKK